MFNQQNPVSWTNLKDVLPRKAVEQDHDLISEESETAQAWRGLTRIHARIRIWAPTLLDARRELRRN